MGQYFDRSSVELLEHDRRYHLHPATNPVELREKGPEMIVRTEGVYLYTHDERQILDACGGLSNVTLGSGNRRLCQVAAQAMQEMSFSHTFGGRSNPFIAALSGT